jgi:hypothetical protein
METVGNHTVPVADDDTVGHLIIGLTRAALWVKQALSNPAVQGFLFLATFGEGEGLEEGVAEGGFRITSSIKNDAALVRAAEKAANNETVQRGLDALTAQLEKGNLNAGLGTKAIQGTSGIIELRGAGGARLYIRQVGANAYDIVAKSSKANQRVVIQQLQRLYPKQ